MHQPELLTLASGASLIDIDGTIFIQFGAFVVMGFLATRWLFKPYLQMRADREAGIDGAREEATRMEAEADARLADYESKLESARGRAHAEQRKIRAEAADHERKVTDEARAENTKAVEAAREKIASEVEAARKELMPRANELANQIATKLLGRKVA